MNLNLTTATRIGLNVLARVLMRGGAVRSAG